VITCKVTYISPHDRISGRRGTSVVSSSSSSSDFNTWWDERFGKITLHYKLKRFNKSKFKVVSQKINFEITLRLSNDWRESYKWFHATIGFSGIYS